MTRMGTWRCHAMLNPANIHRFVGFCSGLSMVVGLLGLAGCYFHLLILRTIVPGMVAIAANAALCFILLGISLWCLHDVDELAANRWKKWLAKFAAAGAAVVGLLSLVEYLGNLSLGIDQLIFAEPASAMLGHVRPGLMSPITALDFVLLGSALLALDWVTRRRTWPAQVLCFISSIIALFTLLDLIANPGVYRAHIALQTVTVLSIFPFAVVGARPERALGGLLLASGSKKALVRKLLFPTSAVGPWEGPLQYALAVVLATAATLLRYWLGDSLPAGQIFLTYYPAVMLAALLGGLGPGILATLLSATCANYFFLPPFGVFTIASRGDLLSLLIFASIGLAISWLASTLEETREEAAAALRRSEAHLKGAQRIAHLGSWTLDVKTGAVTWSDELYRMFGLDPSSPTIPYQEQPKIFTPETWSQLSAAVDETVRTGKPYELELETVLPDGGHGWMLARGEAQREASDEVTTLRGIALDITEQRKSQQKIRQQAALLDLAHDAIFVRDLDSRIVFWNRGAHDLYGWCAEEAVGKISHDLLKSEFSESPQTIETALRQTPTWEGEITHTTRQGKQIVAASRWSLLRDANGNPTAILEINRDITQRKAAEEKLREASLYTRSLIEASLDPLVTISRDGKITDVNRATVNATGVARERLIDSDFSDNFTEPEKARQGYRQVFADGFVRDYPLALRHASGKVTDVLYNATVFTNERGEVEGVFAAARDVTERKRAEQALQIERQRFRDVLDRLPVYVILLTPDYHVALDNTVFRERFGESHGRQCYDYLFGRKEPCETCETYKVLKDGHPHQWKWTGPDGRRYDIFDFPFTDSDGSPLILEMGMDVTERERAEAALQQSESNFRALANFVPQMVWMCKPDGLNIYFNQRWFDYTGMSQDESYGKGWNTPFHPDDKQAAWDAWNHAVVSGDGYRVESRLRARDGSYRWFLIRGTSMRDDAGKIIRWFGTCTDIDDMKRAEAELAGLNRELDLRVQRRTAELEASNKELEAFTYSIAHDLRAPLRHIGGFSKILSEEFADKVPEEAQGYLQRIQEGTTRMGVLVDDLLNLARVGRRELSSQVCGLRQIVDEVIGEMRTECEKREVEWKVGTLPFIECDPGLIKQVFANLIANALKFTRPRERTVIEIGQQNDGPIFVCDNGVGFSMKYADKLFGVFQRLHRQEDFEGTGVGLATVQRIIHKHGGQIWARAELDRGATFYFTLARSESRTESATAGQ